MGSGRAPTEGMSLAGVTAGYGEGAAVRGVSLRAVPGEITGLIGPNGSGKTTVVRVASRGLRPRRGSVRMVGVDPYGISARHLARLVAVVPQEMAPAFSYSVLEIVAMGRSAYLPPWGGGRPADWAAVRRAMEATKVQSLADRSIEELSGGERQRVVLAQALAQETPVLLLDEPTTHLDLLHVLELLRVVQVLARAEGRAVLAVFHDLNLAASFCDRIYALEGGGVVAEGSPRSVLTPGLVQAVFGVEAEVSTGHTGRPVVTPVLPGPDDIRRPGAPRTHVVGGAGRGAASMRALLELGCTVSVGVVHAGDTDAVVAERLNLLRITVPAFSDIDPASAADCLELLRRSDLVVVADAPFGSGNLENLRLAERAAAEGVPTILLERSSIQDRDFTGGAATVLWLRLRETSTVVGNEEELVRVAGALVPARTPG